MKASNRLAVQQPIQTLAADKGKTARDALGETSGRNSKKFDHYVSVTAPGPTGPRDLSEEAWERERSSGTLKRDFKNFSILFSHQVAVRAVPVQRAGGNLFRDHWARAARFRENRLPTAAGRLSPAFAFQCGREQLAGARCAPDAEYSR
jgi:hypothetical protein